MDTKPQPPLTAYGLPQRTDPLTHAYVMTARTKGKPFRDPTNGRLYVMTEDGSLRRCRVAKDTQGVEVVVARVRDRRRGRR